MTQQIWNQEPEPKQELQFPIMLKVMTDEGIKEYHLKRLYELSLKLIVRGDMNE